MKTVFKKIEEIANLVSEVPNGHEGACIILATPDAQDENEQTLCYINGAGVNIIETIAVALAENKNLRMHIKYALALVEGQEVMVKMAKAKMAKAKMKHQAENKAKEPYAGESDQPNKLVTLAKREDRNRNNSHRYGKTIRTGIQESRAARDLPAGQLRRQ